MSHSNVIRIIHPYVPALINFVERWLSQKASNGWRLEAIHGWRFVFRKCTPYTTRFFSYSSFGTSMGISYDYLRSKKRYSCSKSAINKSASIIYEVDIRKIDNDFYGFVFLRNKYYLKHYLGLLLFAIVYTVISLGLMFISSTLAVFFVIGIILLVYSLFSVFILAREISNQSDNTHKTGDGSNPLKKSE